MILIGSEKDVDGTETGKGNVIVDEADQEVDLGKEIDEAIVVEIDRDPEIDTEAPGLTKGQDQEKGEDGQDHALEIEGKQYYYCGKIKYLGSFLFITLKEIS